MCTKRLVNMCAKIWENMSTNLDLWTLLQNNATPMYA